MERQKQNKENKIVGVVYKYTSPSGKVYIGQTTNESHRRKTWFCTKYRYAGAAINKARAKYGPENFEYEVLYKGEFDTFEDAVKVLDKIEIEYIKKYDSLKNGYNNTTGGLFPEYGLRTKYKDRYYNKQKSISSKRHRILPKIKHTKEEIQQLRKETNRANGRWRAINQFSLDGKLLKVFVCAQEAQESGFGNSFNIRRACIKLGKYNGFYWRYADNGDVLTFKPKKTYNYEEYSYARHPIDMFSLSGEYIKSFDSLKSAKIYIGVGYTSGITACAQGKLNYAHGYVWKYKN